MQGLLSLPAILSLVAWYITSFLTLFMNKYTLSDLKVEVFLFSTVQIGVSTVFGLVNMYYPCYMGARTREWGRRPRSFYYNMAFVGLTRFLVVFLSLLSLEYVAVSFTETVKSSAPIFTVLMSWLLLGERNGVKVIFSLIPIVLGLCMCSHYEASYNFIGFVAAMATNLTECLQFVLSKKTLSGDINKTTPAEFQFYSCLMSLLVQTPICLYFMDYRQAYNNTTLLSGVWMLLNGLMYHYQTMTAWVLMEYVSSVTHSVCNTVKRAIAIWLSVWFYGNPVSLLGGLGTVLVTIGVLLYNRAKQIEMGVLKMRDGLGGGEQNGEKYRMTTLPMHINTNSLDIEKGSLVGRSDDDEDEDGGHDNDDEDLGGVGLGGSLVTKSGNNETIYSRNISSEGGGGVM